MQTNRWSMKTSAAVFALALGALAGCSGNPSSGNAAYREGELGNGDFLFACDDGLACLPYAGAAQKFPKAIATGSTFDVRFVAKNQQGLDIVINEQKYEGIKAVGVAPFVGDAPEGGFSALAPGYGSIVVRDSRNIVIDYVTIKIVKPNDLVVYDANYDVSRGKDDIVKLQKLNLTVETPSSYRVVAEYNNESIAGSVPVKWTSKDPSIVEVESYSKRVVNLRGKAAGTATLVADGAGLQKEISVEVKP
jgi:hypothetical protein